MRPASPVRYASTPRSPSRLRASSHAPHFKVNTQKTATTEVHLISDDAQLKPQHIVPELIISHVQNR